MHSPYCSHSHSDSHPSYYLFFLKPNSVSVSKQNLSLEPIPKKEVILSLLKSTQNLYLPLWKPHFFSTLKEIRSYQMDVFIEKTLLILENLSVTFYITFIKFLLRQFWICTGFILAVLTFHLASLSHPLQPPFLPTSSLSTFIAFVLSCNSLGFIRAICMTMGLELSTGAWWMYKWRQWPSVPQNLP